MATFTNQQTRLLTLSTPLGEDVLLLTAFSGQEALSRLFSYQLDMLSEEEDIKPQDIVGKNVTWGVQEVDKEPRYFNGHVSRFSASGSRLHDRRVYRMEVVPYLWFLTRTANCRIFQNKTTPQIIEEIFGDYGLTDFEPALKRSFTPWDYCVQYRETAFNFVARLMEHEGIFFYFKHDNGKHTLVIADHKGAYKDVPEGPVDYYAGTLAPNHLDSWEHGYEFRAGKWAQTDYNFETPSTSLLTNTDTIMDLPGVDKFEVFDYPGEYRVKANGEADVKVRMEEEEAAHDVVTSSGGCPTFSPGFKFTLASHEVEAEVGKSYVLTSIQHSAMDASLEQNGQASEYHNTFTCIPAGVTYRPPRLTPKPIVQGPQTAVVVGPKGEEIYTDKYGRIKVQFHWDRLGKKDENSSCWLRIAQDWAGKGWGMISIPRIGQEVVVDFLEGDPDQPLVTGRVYNAEQMPPFGMPDAKMVSGWKSNSTPGGGGYNEMSFDDTKGKEKITIHGQYDMNTTVEHDEAMTVHNNRTVVVDVDHTEIVTGKQTSMVTGTVVETYSDSQSTIVTKGILITSTSANIHEVAATEVMLNSGSSTLLMKQDGTIELTGVKITIVGSSEITLSAPTLNIAGKNVLITGEADVVTGAPKVEISGDEVAVAGKKITSSADGDHVITGGIVKIN